MKRIAMSAVTVLLFGALTACSSNGSQSSQVPPTAVTTSSASSTDMGKIVGPTGVIANAKYTDPNVMRAKVTAAGVPVWNCSTVPEALWVICNVKPDDSVLGFNTYENEASQRESIAATVAEGKSSYYEEPGWSVTATRKDVLARAVDALKK